MDWVGTVLTVAGSVLVTFIGSYFLLRGEKVKQQTVEVQTEANATEAFLKGQQTFQAYVEELVAKRVEAAVADLKQEVDDLTAAMRKLQRESHEMNDAIRARETQLWLWNIRNRPGPMPELPMSLLSKLGIAHLSSFADLEDTLPTDPPPNAG